MVTKKHKECENCPSLCCKNLSIMITRPRTKGEVEGLMWQLHFKAVKVYIRKYKWYMLVDSKCMYLDGIGNCRIYNKRSKRCREHDPDICEYNGKWFDSIFHNPVDLQKYIKKNNK